MGQASIKISVIANLFRIVDTCLVVLRYGYLGEYPKVCESSLLFIR